jgi:hypothetical protein
VVEEVGRRVRARVGAPPRWDLHGTENALAELGSAEDLVLAVTTDVAPHALPPPEPEPEPAPQPELARDPEPVVVLGTDLTPESLENPTLDLPPVPRPVFPTQSQARVSQTAGAPPPRFPPLPPGEGPPRIRPLAPDETVGRDTLAGLNRLGWEVVALAILGIGVFVLGYLAWLLGAVLVARSRYWEISDKVRVLIGLPAGGLGVAVVWAWLESTQIQESNDSSTRLSEAGHSLAASVSTFPELFGVLGALYLAYALVRDHHAG